MCRAGSSGQPRAHVRWRFLIRTIYLKLCPIILPMEISPLSIR